LRDRDRSGGAKRRDLDYPIQRFAPGAIVELEDAESVRHSRHVIPESSAS
jgi:hypothetical protein